ncbi:MAG: hypothetical protein AB7D35_09180 [Bacteroidales bacterium]
MPRKIIAVLVGILAGFLIIELLEFLRQYFLPFQAEIIIKNNGFPDAQEWIEALPLNYFIFLLIAYLAGSFGAGFLTVTISPHKILAFVTGFALLISVVIQVFSLPHPLWFIIVSLSIFLPFAYLGGILSMKLFRKS